jgi:fructuronate reductase
MRAGHAGQLRRRSSIGTGRIASLFLSLDTLAQVPASVHRPSYQRPVTTGVVHFGPGAFHRAHQAWFLEKLLPQDPRWGICGISLRSPDLRDALARQDNLYTLVSLGEEITYQVIGAVREVLVAPENPQGVLDRLSAPSTCLVTVTVTEKGYCLDGAGNLDLAREDIQRDLRELRAPATLPGYLLEGLRRRRLQGSGPLAIVSCDNLSRNGMLLGRAVRQMAYMLDRSLARWIEDQVRFPRTMVDSITPATTDALRQQVAAALSIEDAWPVQRERFVQWVIEKYEDVEGPDWAQAGVTVTEDVGAYEQAKLRLLNGAHSTLAYLGLLTGHETVAQAMRDERLSAFVETLMREDILPSLRASRDLDLPRYITDILARFRNPALEHRLAQIAWDGSQKLPVRLLGTISDALEAGRPVERLALPIAAWLRFVRRQALAGEPLVDPLAARLCELGGASQGRAAQDLPLFLALSPVFPSALAASEPFLEALGRAYDQLSRDTLPLRSPGVG